VSPNLAAPTKTKKNMTPNNANSVITINTWKNNCIIAHDPHSIIEIDSLNELLVSLIDKIGDNNQDIERAKRDGEYLCIAVYANLKWELLTGTFQEFLKKSLISYNWKDRISDEDISLFNELNLLPSEDPHTGSTGGGTPDDTTEIELGILPLVTALNAFDGIRTFGSCEGHEEPKIYSSAYVSWTACNIDGLNYSTFLLKNAINNVWEERKLNDDDLWNTKRRRITLSFNTGYWKPAPARLAPLPGENYYNFLFAYDFKNQSFVFDLIKDIAEHMINEKYEMSQRKYNG